MTIPQIIPNGSLAKTTQANPKLENEWTAQANATRRWGDNVTVIDHSNSHGSCVHVVHSDGSLGCYDPSELETL